MLILKIREAKANVINNFSVPVGCVPRMHRLIGVIGDHALQGCISSDSEISLLIFVIPDLISLPRTRYGAGMTT
jgi:hypothetical protein